MIDAEIIEGIEQNKALKKAMLDRHRRAFDLWLRLAQLTEEAVVKDRDLSPAFARALDLFFIQAFKSHQSLYPLCIMGHGEDAATIARRLLEIALQVGYLCAEESKQEERGEEFLAHFWHNARNILNLVDLPDERRKWWEQMYDRHKKWLKFDSKGNPVSFWFGSSLADLAKALGLQDTYDKDYRLLSHIAHCSSRGLLLDKVNNVIEIKSDRLIRQVLVYGTKYALAITTKWNELFHLIGSAKLDKLCEDANNFDFRR